MTRTEFLGSLHNPIEEDGFLTEFRNVVADFGDAVSKLDGDISKYDNVFEVFVDFTGMFNIFISDMVGDISGYVRALLEFNGLVRKLGRVVSDLDENIPEMVSISRAFMDIRTEYRNAMIEFHLALAELMVGDGVNDFAPKVSPASKEKIERLEKVKITDEDACSICLDVLSVASEATRLRCSHNFHGDCIANWLKTSEICPLWRSESPC